MTPAIDSSIHGFSETPKTIPLNRTDTVSTLNRRNETPHVAPSTTATWGVQLNIFTALFYYYCYFACCKFIHTIMCIILHHGHISSPRGEDWLHSSMHFWCDPVLGHPVHSPISTGSLAETFYINILIYASFYNTAYNSMTRSLWIESPPLLTAATPNRPSGLQLD